MWSFWTVAACFPMNKGAAVRFLNKISTILLATVLMAASAVAEDFDVYILSGQSNMDGRGLVKDLKAAHPKLTMAQPDIPFWYANTWGDGYSTGWIDLAPGYSIPPGFRKGPKTLPSKTFGVEVVFGSAMVKHSAGRRVAIVKVSRGGTSLVRDWTNPESKKGPLYPLLIDTVKAALADMESRGDKGHLRGMVWHQGEGDTKAKDYAERLEIFVANIRSDLDAPELPLAIGAVHDNGRRDLIRAQQLLAAEQIDHAIHVPCEGLNTFEGTHFDSNAVLEFGQRMADAMAVLQQQAASTGGAVQP